MRGRTAATLTDTVRSLSQARSDEDGTLGTYSMIAGGRAGYGVSYVISSPDAIREMFAPVIPQGAVVLSYSLKQGSRTARFFIAEQAIVRQFSI